ncbi:MAG: class I SAM-dependent methyltransferase [Deltaproteobacteria bacterium]
MPSIAALPKLLFDDLRIQLDAYTVYRYSLIKRFLVSGPIRSLNVGTGGGIETLELLRRGNHVTLVEADAPTFARTVERVKRSGFPPATLLLGHLNEVNLDGEFDQILMCEVLEHIQDDVSALKKLYRHLAPGGRLILSTPTALFGQIGGDQVSIREDGGHVRVGYEGPELDRMLSSLGFVVIGRLYNGNPAVQLQHLIERSLRRFRPLEVLRIPYSFASRSLLPILDLVKLRCFDQITVAIKPSSMGERS